MFFTDEEFVSIQYDLFTLTKHFFEMRLADLAKILTGPDYISIMSKFRRALGKGKRFTLHQDLF